MDNNKQSLELFRSNILLQAEEVDHYEDCKDRLERILGALEVLRDEVGRGLE